jgi:hypothetical protein
VPELQWTQTSYIQPQMHPYDRFFFDGKNYTVRKWLDDVNERYGGVDSILMWPTCEWAILLAALPRFARRCTDGTATITTAAQTQT